MPAPPVSEADLDALLLAANPVDGGVVYSRAVGHGLTAVRSSILDTELEERPLDRSSRRLVTHRMGRRRFVIGFAAAACVGAALLFGLGGSGSGANYDWMVAVTPAQAAELGRVAAVTAQQSGPGPGQWLYQRYEVFEGYGAGWDKVFVSFRETRMVQQWSNANDVERTRSRYTSFAFDTARDRATYRKYRAELGPDLTGDGRDGPLKPGDVTDDADPSEGSSPLSTQDMPDTRAGILDRIRQALETAKSHDPKKEQAQIQKELGLSIVSEVTLILQQSTSERQRAAALKALAYARGVRMLGIRKDVRGREGLAIRYVWSGPGAGRVITLIVDRSSGDLLQDTQISLRPANHLTVAQSLSRTVYFTRAIVGTMSSLPGGGSVPYHGGAPTIAKRKPAK
jgi:hypothetical protein